MKEETGVRSQWLLEFSARAFHFQIFFLVYIIYTYKFLMMGCFFFFNFQIDTEFVEVVAFRYDSFILVNMKHYIITT